MASSSILHAFAALLLSSTLGNIYSDNIKVTYAHIKNQWSSFFSSDLLPTLEHSRITSDTSTPTLPAHNSQPSSNTRARNGTQLLGTSPTIDAAPPPNVTRSVLQRSPPTRLLNKPLSYWNASGYGHRPTFVSDSYCPAHPNYEHYDLNFGIFANSTSTNTLGNNEQSLDCNSELYKLVLIIFIAHLFAIRGICKKLRGKYTAKVAECGLKKNITIERPIQPLPHHVQDLWYAGNSILQALDMTDSNGNNANSDPFPRADHLGSHLAIAITSPVVSPTIHDEALHPRRRKHRGGRQARARKERYLAKQGQLPDEHPHTEPNADICAIPDLSKRVRFNLKVVRPRSGKKVREKKQLAKEREGSPYYTYYTLPDDYEF
ncbi:hypothetical protein BDY19DRAFT_134131 [Irpex rosettiformis]|uniref:Uncharacterized protein n=1 Tax=Irpex rosettiformis TaxID=378272 RepID=A0ACB8U4L9_9APHY|nr:hypothetical protein BDY19DRAFT_134131 [Irpex rosettiformis]